MAPVKFLRPRYCHRMVATNCPASSPISVAAVRPLQLIILSPSAAANMSTPVWCCRNSTADAGISQFTFCGGHRSKCERSITCLTYTLLLCLGLRLKVGNVWSDIATIFTPPSSNPLRAGCRKTQQKSFTLYMQETLDLCKWLDQTQPPATQTITP